MMKLRFILFTAALPVLFLSGCFTSEETVREPQPYQAPQVGVEKPQDEVPQKVERMSTIMVQPAEDPQSPALGASMIQVSAVEVELITDEPELTVVEPEPVVEVTEEAPTIAVTAPELKSIQEPEPAEVVVVSTMPADPKEAPKALAATATKPVDKPATKPTATIAPTRKPAVKSTSISTGSKINMIGYYEKQLERDNLSPELRAYYARKLAEAKANE